VNKATKYTNEIEQYFNFLAEDDNIKAFYTSRPDLGQPSVKGIEVRPLSNGYNTFSAYAKNGSNIIINQAVRFWNEAVIGKAMQDMLAGSITPEECLQVIDADRAQSLESTSGN
jgi:ABC-type glycerol-3-phosphate transport system substrate-binding protein